MIYKCKYCGKEFDNRFSCNGHISRCPSNPTYSSEHTCKFCGVTVIGKHSHTQHENHCELNPDRVFYKSPSVTNSDGVNSVVECEFCGKECKNLRSLSSHRRFCKNNPLKEASHLKHSGWNKGLTKETDIRVANHSKSLKKYYETHTQGFKDKKHSPEVLSKFNRYHSSKRGFYNGILFMSTWELAYYIYMVDSGHKIVRNEEWYTYEVEGVTHRYNPDFIVDDEYIVEIKGYKTEIDDIKWKSVPNIIVLYKKDIKQFISYVSNKFNVKSLEDLYDRRIN